MISASWHVTATTNHKRHYKVNRSVHELTARLVNWHCCNAPTN